MIDQPIDENLAGGRLTIDLDALVANWKMMRDHTAPVECGAVVKGNGYGCFAEPPITALYKTGCRTFFVAIPAEGIRARAVAPDARIYVLNGVFEGSEGVFLEHNLTPVLSTFPGIERWVAVAKAQGRPLECAFQVDSGMNRLGFSPREYERLASQDHLLSHLKPTLQMTHFACADDVGHPKTDFQRENFAEISKLFPDVPRSAANTAGTWQDKANHFDLARPGTAIFGSEALNDVDNPWSPVVTMEGRIIQIRMYEKGAGIGYGATETLKRDSRLAYVSVGYADGYHRAASNLGVAMRAISKGARAYYKGHFIKGVGRISMDMCCFDVTDIPENEIGEGDWIELFGKNIPVDEVATAAGTIGYEYLVGMGHRFARNYIGG